MPKYYSNCFTEPAVIFSGKSPLSYFYSTGVTLIYFPFLGQGIHPKCHLPGEMIDHVALPLLFSSLPIPSFLPPPSPSPSPFISHPPPPPSSSSPPSTSSSSSPSFPSPFSSSSFPPPSLSSLKGKFTSKERRQKPELRYSWIHVP